MKSLFISLLVFVATIFVSCQEEDKTLVAPATSRLVVANAAPTIDASKNIEVFSHNATIGNNNRKANLNFGGVSVFNPKSGEVPLAISFTEDTEASINQTVTLEDYENYSLIFASSNASSSTLGGPIGGILLKDDISLASEGMAKVRILHLAVGAQEVDVYIFPKGTSQPESPTISKIGYSEIWPGDITLQIPENAFSSITEAGFNSISAGDYSVNIRPAGSTATSDPIVKTINISLADRRVNTVILRGFLSAPEGITGRGLSAQTIVHERPVY